MSLPRGQQSVNHPDRVLGGPRAAFQKSLGLVLIRECNTELTEPPSVSVGLLLSVLIETQQAANWVVLQT